jgi:phenylacetate-CoA ligase
MLHERTSGTTGKPLDLWTSRATVQRRYALYEARRRVWNGVTRRDRWAMLGGQLVVPVSRRSPPFWVWNAGLRQLYMSSYHLAPDLLPAYLDALKRYRVRYLFGYSSSLYALALAAIRAGRDDLPMRVAIANAEPLMEHQREAIGRAFGCAVRETYGMAELVAGASECESGRLHMWPCMGHIEVLDGEQPAVGGQAGDLVCTSLLNADMPLVRYRVGDRGALADPRTQCPCGRTLPILMSVEGRADDVLYTRDGRRVGRLDPVFKSHLPICEAQIIQESLDQVRVRFVPVGDFDEADGRELTKHLRDRLGDVEVVLEPVAAIGRTAQGKFRAVVCELPESLRRELDDRLPRPTAS